MAQSPVEPRWPKVLSLAVHEFRTPMTVVAGYIRMLLKDRAGPLTEPQRRLLEEAEKSCGRLSALLSRDERPLGPRSGHRHLQSRRRSTSGRRFPNPSSALPELPDRPIEVDLQVEIGTSRWSRGIPFGCAAAFTAVLMALRRELVTSTTLAVRETVRQVAGRTVSWIAIADPDQIEPVANGRRREPRGRSTSGVAAAASASASPDA